MSERNNLRHSEKDWLDSFRRWARAVGARANVRQGSNAGTG